MYRVMTTTVPLIHGTVFNLRIYGEGYIAHIEPFRGGYSQPHAQVFFVSSVDATLTSPFKDVAIYVSTESGTIDKEEIESATPIKSFVFEGKFYHITAEFI